MHAHQSGDVDVDLHAADGDVDDADITIKMKRPGRPIRRLLKR